tara:strand:- start:58 stop:363 length:306 start_codon:yes stop_codon:yes gene_type:complete
MVWDPKPETVNVNRMMIYSLVPILSAYALWRIQKFWLISLISIPISLGVEFLMTALIYVEPTPPFGAILSFMALGLYIATCVLLVKHYAQKYNEKITKSNF